MTSEKQVQANRANAKLGGVKTEGGKLVSRFNALKHGLLSQEVLLEEEDEQSLLELEKRLRRELSPETELELMLVDRIAANIWRLRRAMKVEREMMESNRTDDIYHTTLTLGETLRRDFANADSYGKFIRYETSIERGIYKALHELQRMQAVRLGQKIPPPLAIDIDVSSTE